MVQISLLNSASAGVGTVPYLFSWEWAFGGVRRGEVRLFKERGLWKTGVRI